jgi:hypothetical protein
MSDSEPSVHSSDEEEQVEGPEEFVEGDDEQEEGGAIQEMTDRVCFEIRSSSALVSLCRSRCENVQLAHLAQMDNGSVEEDHDSGAVLAERVRAILGLTLLFC